MSKVNHYKTAKYIIRFDDLCPEMNWEAWNEIERILYKYDIKPIIAVVPSNEDIKLKKEDARIDFWDKIQKYQKDGFMVALHGYNHIYTNQNSGILGISANSEFATLSYEVQKRKIELGLEIFNKKGITANAFIAPSHSLDNNTLKALKDAVSIISDGHTNYPYRYKGFLWIPCQLWGRIIYKQKGLYTVCIHPNNWAKANFGQFEKDIQNFREQIISPFEVSEAYEINICGKIQNIIKSFKYKLKRFLKRK